MEKYILVKICDNERVDNRWYLFKLTRKTI